MPETPPPPVPAPAPRPRTVACDGGLGALGHPRVYLDAGHGPAVCPYCGAVLTPAGDDAAGENAA